jgi:ATPase subunit of ABC transporter with duplicated ATPase domains
VLTLKDVGIDGLVWPFSDEVHFGERVGVIGPNGGGKTHLVRLLAGAVVPHDGEVVTGPRVSRDSSRSSTSEATSPAAWCSTSRRTG